MLRGQGIELEISQKAKGYLARKGYDPQFGARPLKRVIQTEVENELARQILAGKFKKGDKIKLTFKKGKLVFQKAK